MATFLPPILANRTALADKLVMVITAKVTVLTWIIGVGASEVAAMATRGTRPRSQFRKVALESEPFSELRATC